MEKKYPFKFLDSYNQNDTDIFFGRDEEIEALYEMVFQNSILLVYGASGTGKTSLIQCGLASKFKSYDWLALTVRRGTNINESLEKALIAAGGDDIDEDESKTNDSSKKLTGLLRLIKGVYLNSFKPIYLIFDQFEELYILGTKGEQEKFIQDVKEMLNTEQPLKMIFSIREEYLGHLFEFEKQIPQLLRKKLRVEPMTLNKVTDVIKGINNSTVSNVKIKADEVDAITQGIFERLRGKKKTLTIQLPYLQVFLDKLYLETTKDETRKADALIGLDALNRIGDIGDVLRNFLEEQVAGISKKLSGDNKNINPETIWRILSPFSTLEGTKEPISKKELSERLKDLDPRLISEAVESFVNSRIVNYSETSNLYELAHDSLALRIAEKRSDEEISLLEVRRLIKNQVSLKQDARELFSRKQLNFIEPYLHKLNLTEEEENLIKESKEEERKADKRKRARRRTIIISIAAVTMLVIAGLSFFLIQQSIAKNKNIELLSNSYWNNSKSRQAENDYVYALVNASKAFSISRDKRFKENMLMEIENKWPVVNLKNILTAKSRIMSAAYINDGKQIITLSKDYTFTIWDALTGDSVGAKPKLKLDETDRIFLSTFSPDGKNVMVDGPVSFMLWNIATSKMILADSDYVPSAGVSRDGSKYFNISYDGTTTYKINLFNLSGKVVFSKSFQTQWESEEPKGSFSANGNYLAVKYNENRVMILDAISGKSRNLNLKAYHYQTDDVQNKYDTIESDYKSSIKTISFDNQGKTFLTANSDSTIRLWDAETGIQKADSMKHSRPVDKAYFSPDGSVILAIDEENSTFLWDVTTSTKLGHAFKLEPSSAPPVFSPDGKNILSVIDGTVSVWQLLQRKDESNHAGANEAFDYDFSKNRFFSPDLKKMVTKKTKKGFFVYQIFDAGSLKPVGPEITSKYNPGFNDDGVWFSPDSKRLLTRYTKHSIQLWNPDLATRIGDTIPLDHLEEPVFSPVEKEFNSTKRKPGTRKLMTTEDLDTIIKFQLWNIEIGKKIGTEIVRQKKYQQPVQNNANPLQSTDASLRSGSRASSYEFQPPVFSADGNWVFIFFTDHDSLYYELYDAGTGSQKGPRHSQPADFETGFKPILNADGTLILEMINDSTCHLLNAETGERKGDVFLYHPNWPPVYSPDGKWLLICAGDDAVQFIDIATRNKKGNAIKHLSSADSPDMPSINKDGTKVLTIGKPGSIHLWNIQTQKQIKGDIKHESNFIPPVFSPDGKLFLTSDDFGSARLYDAETGLQKGPALKHPKTDIRQVVFSNDAKKILLVYSDETNPYSTDFTIVIWNAETGLEIPQDLGDITLPSLFIEDLSSYLSFSEDGKWVLGGNYFDQQLINTEAGDLDIPADLLELQVLMSSGYRYDFSIDEKQIITSGEFYGNGRLKENYYKKAVAHYKVCKFSKYNLWRRFNEEEAKKIRPDDFIEQGKKDTTDSEFQMLTAFNKSDTSKINNGSYLEPGQGIYSNNKEFLLAYQEDGNLVIYRKNGMQPIWESNTSGYPAYRTVMQYDGNLVIYAADPGKTLGNNAIWSSDTWNNNAGAALKLEDDGSLVIYNKKNKPVWNSKPAMVPMK